MAIFKGKLMLAGLNAKTTKGDGSVYATAIMYLAPAQNVAGVNLCPTAKLAGCEAACLFRAGRGAMSNVEAARVRKTEFYRDNRTGFMAQLVEDLEAFAAWCGRRGVKPVVRLNGTSDVQWEVGHECLRADEAGQYELFPSIFAAFPEVQFYDYTKIAKRVRRPQPANYDLTLSYSGASEAYAAGVLEAGRQGARVAVVFADRAAAEGAMRDGFQGLAAIDGDDNDLRFEEPAGVVVALYAKGPAKRDATGFVVR